MLDGEGQGNRWEEVRMDQRGGLKEEGGDSAGTGWGGASREEGAHLALCLLPQL